MSHVLYLRLETVSVCRRMNMVLEDNDGEIISENEWGLNFLTFVLLLRKNVNQKIDTTGNQTKIRYMRGNDIKRRPQQRSRKFLYL